MSATAPPTHRTFLEERIRRSGEAFRLVNGLDDPLDQSNLFALDPTFPWSEHRPPEEFAHPELLEWRWGSFSRDGAPIKTYSLGFLQQLAWAVDVLTPLINDLGVDVAAWYEFENGSDQEHGGIAMWPVVVGGRRIPCVVCLASGYEHRLALVATGIHELAHCPRRGFPEGFREHGEDFRRSYGSLLAHLLQTDEQLHPFAYRQLRRYAATDEPPPIYPWENDPDG